MTGAGTRLAAAAILVSLTGASARAETLLNVAETATVMVHPDELVAVLRAEGVANSPAEAQARANTIMADAIARAKQVSGVTVATGAYNVWRLGPTTPQEKVERWQAHQSIELRGHDGAPLLRLVGDLQQKGLAVSQLAWQLSPEAALGARRQATGMALKALRGRVDDAASLLGLRFASFRAVRLNGAGTGVSPPFPQPRSMMAAAAVQGLPPSAEAEDVPVTASADADAVLEPKSGQ